MKWFLYIVKATDGSFYTGITINIKRRVNEHNNKKGSKALKGKLPVVLVYSETLKNRSEASRRENEIKSLTKKQKLALITGL
jgi:putative endonuclease